MVHLICILDHHQKDWQYLLYMRIQNTEPIINSIGEAILKEHLALFSNLMSVSSLTQDFSLEICPRVIVNSHTLLPGYMPRMFTAEFYLSGNGKGKFSSINKIGIESIIIYVCSTFKRNGVLCLQTFTEKVCWHLH